MIFQEIFLFNGIHLRHGLQLAEMRPAIIIRAFRLIIAAGRQQAADGDMHQVLLLLLGKFFFQLPGFLDADKK